MKQAIKEKLAVMKLGHEALCTYSLFRQRARLKQTEAKARETDITIYGANELENNKKTNHHFCHVIGSGWSLATSMHLTDREDAYVIGFNFACLSSIKFDTYFIEFGGPAYKDIAVSQRACLDVFEKHFNGPVIFKNLWDPMNDLEYASNLYKSSTKFIRDMAVPCYHEKYLETACKTYLEPDWFYLRQYQSTALTAINYARMLGFKNIVLHGIDFGGGYFFDLPDFSDVKALAPPRTNPIGYSTEARKNRHPTAVGNVGINKIFPLIQSQLSKEGVKIYAATRYSPLSKILPIYEVSDG